MSVRYRKTRIDELYDDPCLEVFRFPRYGYSYEMASAIAPDGRHGALKVTPAAAKSHTCHSPEIVGVAAMCSVGVAPSGNGIHVFACLSPGDAHYWRVLIFVSSVRTELVVRIIGSLRRRISIKSKAKSARARSGHSHQGRPWRSSGTGAVLATGSVTGATAAAAVLRVIWTERGLET